MTSKVKVQLSKPHTHAGVDYPKDEVIEVSPQEAAWLERRGRGKAIATPTAPATTATSARRGGGASDATTPTTTGDQ